MGRGGRLQLLGRRDGSRLSNHPKKESSDYNNEVWENYRRFADEGFPVYRQFVKEQWDEFYADYSGKVKLTYDMPTAKQNNPQLEAEMLAVARTVYDDGRTALKAIIQSTDWAYDRTALGQIINRNQSAYIIYKMPDGRTVPLSWASSRCTTEAVTASSNCGASARETSRWNTISNFLRSEGRAKLA